MRVLVTGSRQFMDQALIYHNLDGLFVEWLLRLDRPFDDVFTVVHGGAAGADSLAGEWADDKGRQGQPVEQEVHPALWARYGKLAGGIRNGEMVRAGADQVLAFFQPGAGNHGTRNCVNQARLVRLSVREVWA